MLKHSCKEFASPFHSISHLKALVGLQNKIKTWGFFQKWKPSLIKVKEVGGYNSFVKPLKVEACANGRQGGKCQQLSPVRKWKDSLSGLCWGRVGGAYFGVYQKMCWANISWWPQNGCHCVSWLPPCWRKILNELLSPPTPIWMPDTPCPSPQQATGLYNFLYKKKWSLWLDSHMGFFNVLVYFGGTPEHFVDGLVSWPWRFYRCSQKTAFAL